MATPTSTDSLTDAVRAFAERAVADAAPNAYVVDVEIRGYQGSRVVSVYVDTDTGIDLDETAAVSRALSAALDQADLVKGRYRLDVSSPGADRPLIEPRQLPRHVGRTLAVTYTSDEGEVVTATGELTAAEVDAFTIATPGDTAPRVIASSRLIEAQVQLPW